MTTCSLPWQADTVLIVYLELLLSVAILAFACLSIG
jgi:hypothetical protein